MEKPFRKIEYTTKKDINLTNDNVSPEAKSIINSVNENTPLVLRVRINTPVYIEAAAILTSEGIKEVCKANDL